MKTLIKLSAAVLLTFNFSLSTFYCIRIKLLAIVYMLLLTNVLTAQKEWTIMIYMGGDRALEPNAIDDINAFEAGIDTSNYTVVVQLDRIPGYDNSNGNWTSCKRFLVQYDTIVDNVIRSTELSDIGEVNMGDPQTLTDFITWGMQNYQSKRYALVVWGSASPMGICPDETSGGDPLNVIAGEVTAALKQSTTSVQRRIDLFVAWGCNYGTFEHDNVVKEYVDVTVRSQLATWNAEGAATDIMEWLNLNPLATAKEFAIAWVDAYTDYAISQGRCTGWAALDLNPKYVKLGTDLDLFARELIKAGGTTQPDISNAMTNTVYSYGLEFDMCHFAKNITNATALPQALKNAAQELIDTYGYTSPYPGNPLLNFRFADGFRDPNETWPTGDTAELRGCKIYQQDYAVFEGNPPPFGCDTAYVPFKMNNAWKWFIADSTSLPNEVLLTYESNSLGDSVTANGFPVTLDVTLRNSGGADATVISGVLSTSDPYVSITQANSNYSDIASEGAGASLSAFQIDIDTAISNGHRIWFRLDITANSGSYTNTTSFCLETTKELTTGNTIHNRVNDMNVLVYPNPASNLFHILLPSVTDQEIIFEIYNMTGQRVWHNQYNAVKGFNRFTVSTNQLENGIYTLRITENKGETMRYRKLVKQDNR